jgi:hypothetical protein
MSWGVASAVAEMARERKKAMLLEETMVKVGVSGGRGIRNK